MYKNYEQVLVDKRKRKTKNNHVSYVGSHYLKSVRMRSFSCPYFSVFRLNKERYRVSLCIQSECGKIRTRKTPKTYTFQVVSVTNETEKELIDFLNEARFLFLLLFQISHKKSFNVVISTVFSGILFRVR